MSSADADSGVPGAPDKPLDGALSLARQNVGLVAGIVAVAAVALRIAAIAGYDTTTAAALLQYTGGTNVLLGVSLSIIPLLVAYSAVLVVCGLFWRFGADGWRPLYPSLAWMVMSLLIMVIMAPLVAWGFAVVVVGLAYLTGRQDRGRDRRTAIAENHRVAIGVVINLVVVLYLLSSSSWLPAEAIAVGRDEFTGYVAGVDDSGRLVVLRPNPSRITFLDPDDVEGRTLCSNTSPWFDTLLQRLPDGDPGYRACPEN